MIRYEKDTDNIVTLTLDMADNAHNIISHDIEASFLPVLGHLQQEKANGTLKGVVITSAKKTFLVGSDMDFYHNTLVPEDIFNASQSFTRFFRALESPGVPVVAALNGTALGPGFELALACHYRVALDMPNSRLGLPETSLGLMPSGGGVIRLLWLLGLEKAYHVVTDGHSYTPKEALSVGIIDELATTPKEMIDKAKAWLLGHRNARRTWDTVGGTIPLGSSKDDNISQIIRELTALQYKQNYLNYPAFQAVLSTLVEGSRVDFDTACRIQSRYFAKLLMSKEAKSMCKALWYDQNAIKKGENRPKGYGKFRVKKIGIVGSGMMGSGIAYTCAKAGLEVVLKDISRSVAEKGKAYSEEKLAILVQKNELSPTDAKNILDRITATEHVEAFKNCDLVIEAVFENQMLKSKVLKDAENFLDEFSIVASNTSSIPITKLSSNAQRPANFVGLHFFRPVEDEPLVEIVKGEQTSDETIARAFDFVRTIRKTPIVVKDSWGFYAGRVQNTYILEGIAMLQEGYPAALIENIGIQAGMPKGALALADDVGLGLAMEFEQQAASLYGTKYISHPAATALAELIGYNRKGKSVRAGFYEYDGDKRQIWTGIAQYFPTTKTNLTAQDYEACSERLMFSQVLEAIWCLQEGIIQRPMEANLGSIYGWGFPACKGGVLQYINDYGITTFVERCKIYEKAHGRRFKAPKLLREMAEKNEKF